MWGVSLTCSLEACGCFMLGFSLAHPKDVLTIPTAYEKMKEKKMKKKNEEKKKKKKKNEEKIKKNKKK